jgi:ATP-dependent helicase/nuclease subunit A
VSLQDALEMDERARREALDVRRSLLLQAPAGSGKTTVLSARFLSLLAEAAAPEEILAITFTRKASAEMHHRIVDALQAAQSGRTIPGIEDALLRSVAQRDRSCGWELLRNAARLRIETIDALNHRLTGALPIAARAAPSLSITPAPASLYRRAARRALRAALAEPDYAAAARLLLERRDNSWRGVESLLADMLERRLHWMPRMLAARDSGLTERITESLYSVLRSQLAGAAVRLPQSLLREGARLLALLDARAPGPLNAEPASLVHWRALCDLALTAEDDWRKRFAAGNAAEVDPAVKQDVMNWIRALAGSDGALQVLREVRALPDAALGEDDHAAIEALALLLVRAAAELQLLFGERGKVDFAYMSAAARQALSEQGEPSDFALRMGSALRHILIDEFQDTSVDQFELLRALTAGWERGDGRTLFIVGDPMQSIYQFREAEVGLFLRARDHGVGAIELEMLQLRRNFRSRAELVEWINQRFGHIFPADDDARLAAVRFLPSVAAPLETRTALDTGVRLHRVAAGDWRAEAAQVVDIVRASRRQSPQVSIAVLVAAREHATEVALQLRNAGFVLRGVGLEPLAERPAIRDLSALARALLHGADRSAWLAVLRSPWCGLSLQSLMALAGQLEGDAFAALGRGTLPDPDDRARVARLWSALEPAIAGSERGWPLWQRVERSWLRLGAPAIYTDPAEVADARRLLEVLAEHEQPESLVGEAMGTLTEPLFSTAPPQPGAIEIMTMHAAKGLEWDVVILPGLGRRPRSDRDPLLHWIELPRAAEGTDLLLAPIRRADQDEGSLARYIKHLRSARARVERVRRLYVSATRAKCALHVLAALDEPKNGQPPKPPAGSLLEVLWPAIAEEFNALPERSSGANRSDGIARQPPLARLPASWTLPAPPTTLAPHRLLLSAPVGAESPEYSWVGLNARAVGTIVHAELHRLAGLRLQPAPQDLQTRAAYYGGWLAELGVPAADRPAAQALILEALERTLADARGRWLLSSSHARAQSEWRLSGLYGGRIVNVIFDRMLIDDRGQRWVVDYKTSRHEGGAIEQFIDREAERYGPQLRRYAAIARELGAEPVRVALYFPLLSVFRELPI